MSAHSEIKGRGYTILEGVIEPNLIEELLAALDRITRERQIGTCDNEFEGHETVRVYNLLAHDDVFAKVPIHPAVLPVVEQVLDDGCLISSLSSIDIGPNETPQPIHSDDMVIGLPRPHPPLVCNTMWALTDFTEANGATRVIPASHLFEDKLEFALNDTEPAEMEQGSVLFYTGALYHGGGANRSDATRMGLNVTYARGWLRQEENQYLTVPTQVARELPADLLRMIGYARGAYALGYVDDLRDPIEVVRPDEARDGLGNYGSVIDKLRGEGYSGSGS